MNYTKKIATTFAYMIGASKETLINACPEITELIESLEQNKDATIIRYLSKLRTSLLKNYTKTDQTLHNTLDNINKMKWFDKDEIDYLLKNDVNVILANTRAKIYTGHFNELINKYIGKCKYLYPDWVNWEYIKGLFNPPNHTSQKVHIDEFEKYMANKLYYPYQCYFYWKNPSDIGLMLSNDHKFLKEVYLMNEDTFLYDDKIKDAPIDTKQEIYDFIYNSQSTIMAVDCENSNCYAICAVLNNLNQDELDKISKIILYDDPNTTSAWNLLHKYVKIPVETVNVERVKREKSLVDIRMTAGVVQAYCTKQADSFVICSSDSDFWGLISSIPDARFMVLYEKENVSNAIIEAWKMHGINHYDMAVFGSEITSQFKTDVLLTLLRSHLPNLNTLNVNDLTEEIYTEAMLPATQEEKKEFMTKYLFSLKVFVNEEGNFYIDVAQEDDYSVGQTTSKNKTQRR